MPTDQANTFDDYRRLLNHGANKPSPQLFPEVAEYDRPWPLLIRLAILFVCCVASWSIFIAAGLALWAVIHG